MSESGMTEEGNENGTRTATTGKASVAGIDRRMKWWLLVASALTVAILAAAALRENVFADWRTLRGEYLEILNEKATDDRGREAAREFDIRIVQNYVPELGIADRCITCHAGVQDPRMADEAQPFAAHPGRHLEIHDPEKFGCTVCHDGQGRATETADAHDEAPFWDYPMLGGEFVRSSCTKCHVETDLFGGDGLITRADGKADTHGAVLLQNGRTLVTEFGCLGCHRLDGKGGTSAPDLSTIGSRTRHEFSFAHFEKHESHEVVDWLEKHFLDPTAVSPGTIMPKVDDAEDARALTAYMLSRHPREIGKYFYTERLKGKEAASASGRDLYARYCSACHGTDGRGGRVTTIRTPSLNHVDVLGVASDDFYRFTIEKGRSGTHMPAWGPGHGNLTRGEIDRIVTHLRSWEPQPPPLAEIRALPGDAQRGEKQYQQMCGSCHGASGAGGIGNSHNCSPFLAVADDEFLARSIVDGRPGTAMPSWKQLDAQSVSDLVAFIRSWQKPAVSVEDVLAVRKSASSVEQERAGARVYARNCASCHGPQAEGGLGPSLSNDDFLAAVDDVFLYRAITEGRPSTAMPSWTELDAGEIAGLISYLRSFQKSAALTLSSELPPGDRRAGKMYYDVACAECHGESAEGGSGPQLSNPVFLESVSDAALFRWIAKGRPERGMQGFAANGRGDTRLTAGQIADVIAYLRHLGSSEDRPILRAGLGNADAGEERFTTRCASCHGTEGEGGTGPQLNNPALLRAASDGFLTATIVVGRCGETASPEGPTHAFASEMSSTDIADVVAFMRRWEKAEPWRRSRSIADMGERAIASGTEKFASYCAPCHGPNGRGEADGPAYFAPAVNNPEFLEAAEDGFLLATIARGRAGTQMVPFGEGAGGGVALTADDMMDIVSFMRSWQKPDPSKGANAGHNGS